MVMQRALLNVKGLLLLLAWSRPDRPYVHCFNKTHIPRRFHASTENILPAGDDHALSGVRGSVARLGGEIKSRRMHHVALVRGA